MKIEPLDKPIAFVAPWYGEDIPGGAERLCREYVHHLTRAGIAVEVLTTCVQDFASNWNKDYHAPNIVERQGFRVRRFPTRRRDARLFDTVNFKLLNNLAVSAYEEHLFFFESVRSEELEQYLEHEGPKYHLIFMPYCFGTTFEGLRRVDFRGFLLPCVHQERYALLRGSRKMHESARGLIFNSESEQKLASSLYAIERVPQIVLGMGIEPQEPGDPTLFRHEMGIENPYLLYVGRKDATKNTHVLVGYFEQYLGENPDSRLDLVLLGHGDVEIPAAIASRVHNPGYVAEELKRSALAGAEMLAQPSARESFSIVLMEAWMAGAPVVVNEYCQVALEHCRRSNGGLYFSNFVEFEAVVRLLTSDKALARQLAASGRRYVLENYGWDRLIRQLVQFIRDNPT
jgi:glycosyltransferase involved in cell wall biosynthesis